MEDQETALARTQQLQWLMPLLATLLLVWVEVYYFFARHIPIGDVLVDLAVGSAIVWGFSRLAFTRVTAAQRAAANRSRELRRLNLITSRLSAAAHLDEILSVSLDELMQISESDAGGIWLREASAWALAIQRGLPVEILVSVSMPPGSDSLVDSILRTHKDPPDEQQNEGEPEHAAPPPWDNYIALPCFVKGEALALVLLSSPKGKSPSRETMHLLSSAVAQVGMALERGRLLEETKKRMQEREMLFQTVQEMANYLDMDTLLPRIILSAMKAIPAADRGTIHLYDPAEDKRVVRASVGFGKELWDVLGLKPGEGCSGWVYSNQQALLLSDTLNDERFKRIEGIGEMARSGICAPLVTRGKTIGTIFLDNMKSPGAFNEDDLRLLNAFASSAAVAIERANAMEEAQRLAAESGMLLLISQLLTSSTELDQVLQHAVEEGVGLLGVDACVLSLYDQGMGALRVAACEGLDLEQVTEQSATMTTPEAATEAVRGGLPISVEDATRDGRIPVEVAQALGIKSTLIAPLLSRGIPLGILVFHQTTRKRRFSESDKQLALRLGYQAAIAIENARLFARVDRARQEWELTFNAISDAIFILDQEANILQANEPAARLTGKPLEEIIGQRYYQVLSGTDEPPDSCVLAKALQSGKPARGETQDLLPEGVFQISAYPIHNANGEVQGAVSILHDITVEQRLRQELLHAEKLSSLGQTIAGVAHELNNPLQAVVGYSELLRADHSLREETRRDVERIYDAGQRAASIVRNLLTFARKHKREKEPIDINPSIRSILNMQAHRLQAEHIALITDLEEGLPSCYADRHQLQQVWLNLILNAEQAMLGAHGGGLLTIRSFARDANTIHVEFVDDGPGIPNEIMGQIFDPFFTTKGVGEGTGLGLAVCFGIVRAHGGRIWAESRMGQGATFVVELPVMEIQAQEIKGPLELPHAKALGV